MPPLWKCSVCGRDVYSHAGTAKGFCARCYQRRRRGAPPATSPASLKSDVGAQVNVRFEAMDLALMAVVAELDKVGVRTWIRDAAMQRLERELETGTLDRLPAE